MVQQQTANFIILWETTIIIRHGPHPGNSLWCASNRRVWAFKIPSEPNPLVAAFTVQFGSQHSKRRPGNQTRERTPNSYRRICIYYRNSLFYKRIICQIIPISISLRLVLHTDWMWLQQEQHGTCGNIWILFWQSDTAAAAAYQNKTPQRHRRSISNNAVGLKNK